MPSECLFEELKVHTFPDLITHELAKFGYKVMNKLYPKPILTLLNSQGGNKKLTDIPLGTRQPQTFRNINQQCTRTASYAEDL